MLSFQSEAYSHPNSFTSLGERSRFALQQARQQVADFFSISSENIVFSYSVLEVINSLDGVIKLDNNLFKEHPSIIKDKAIDKQYLDDYLKVNVGKFLFFEYADSATGTIINRNDIIEIAKKHNLKTICDISSVIGREVFDVNRLNIDIIVVSGHKIGGPVGICAVLQKEIIINEFPDNIYPIAQIVGLGYALEALYSCKFSDMKNYSYIIDQLQINLSNCNNLSSVVGNLITGYFIIIPNKEFNLKQIVEQLDQDYRYFVGHYENENFINEPFIRIVISPKTKIEDIMSFVIAIKTITNKMKLTNNSNKVKINNE